MPVTSLPFDRSYNANAIFVSSMTREQVWSYHIKFKYYRQLLTIFVQALATIILERY